MAENPDQQERRSRWRLPVNIFFKDARNVFKLDQLGREILGIALPAALAVAADPIASLIDTAFVGHLGPVELAAVGVSIAIFNQASRITIFPLVSVTTSFVAEEDTLGKANLKASKSGTSGRTSAENGRLELAAEGDSQKDMENGLAKQDSGNPMVQGVEYEMEEFPGEDTTPHSLDKRSSSSKNEMKEPHEESVVLDLEKGIAETTMENIYENTPAEEETNNSAVDGARGLEVLEKDPDTTEIKSPPLVPDKKDKTKKNEKRHIASASTALIFGAILGLLQAIFLIFGAKVLLGLMGVKHHSPMLAPARKYLVVRSLGSPAVLLSLAMQGIFRGFKDTKTPLYVIVLGYTVNIILDPVLIYVCHLGVRGAAIAHVISQYLIVLVLLWRLMQKVDLLPPNIKDLQFGRFMKNGGLLLARVIAVTFCVTLAASLAARLGSMPMAAFQTCLQVWMTSSLLADGLAVAGQAILACAFTEKDFERTTATAARVLQLGFILGVGLAVICGFVMYFGAGIFTRDIHVQHLIHLGIPFVAGTQPMNTLAFIFDGVNFGASDFAYSAYSLVLVAAVSIASLFVLKAHGFVGIWTALTIYMALRAFAGAFRMGTGTGPWRYLRKQLLV